MYPPEYCAVANYSQTYGRPEAWGWSDTNCMYNFIFICRIQGGRRAGCLAEPSRRPATLHAFAFAGPLQGGCFPRMVLCPLPAPHHTPPARAALPRRARVPDQVQGRHHRLLLRAQHREAQRHRRRNRLQQCGPACASALLRCRSEGGSASHACAASRTVAANQLDTRRCLPCRLQVGGRLVSWSSQSEQYEVELFYLSNGLLIPNFHMAYWMGLASTPADPTFFLWSDGTPPPGIDRRYAHWGKLRLADKNAPRVGRRCSCPPMRAGQWRAHCECAAKGRPSRPGRPTATLSMAGTRCRFRSPTTWPGTSTAAWPTRASRTARAGDGRTPRAAAPSPRSARSHVGALHRPPCCALHCCFFAACLPACLPACLQEAASWRQPKPLASQSSDPLARPPPRSPAQPPPATCTCRPSPT